MLGGLVRELVGRDADNAMSSLLAGAAAAEVPLEAIAPELVRNLVAYDDRRGLREENLAGAFAIAMAAGNETLVDRILARPEANSNAELALRALEAAPKLLPAHFDTIVEVMPVAVAVHPARAKAALDRLELEDRMEILRTAAEPVLEMMEATSETMEAGPDESAIERQVRVAREMSTIPTRLAELYLPDQEICVELALLPILRIAVCRRGDFRMAPPNRAAELSRLPGRS